MYFNNDTAKNFILNFQKDQDHNTKNKISDELLNSKIQINGELYRIPAKVDDFLKNGWLFRESYDYKLRTNSRLVGQAFEKRGSYLGAQIYNPTDEEIKAIDGMVGFLKIKSTNIKDNVVVTIADDITLNKSTVEDVVSVFGEPSKIDDTDLDNMDITKYIYEKEPYKGISLKFNEENILVEFNVHNMICD